MGENVLVLGHTYKYQGGGIKSMENIMGKLHEG